MRIISVINYKGGVGKTTITANMAAYMAIQGKKVLMLDLDPQASLTFSFVEPTLWHEEYCSKGHTIKDAIDAFVKNGESPDLYRYAISLSYANEMVEYAADYGKNGSISLVCSNLNLLDTDQDLACKLVVNQQKSIYKTPIMKIMGYELCCEQDIETKRALSYEENFINVHTFLTASLERLRQEKKYDVVLIDCPPNIGILNKNALLASDYYVIPAKPEFLSTYGIPNMNAQIDKIVNKIAEMRSEEEGEQELRPSPPKLLGVLFNMVRPRGDGLINAHENEITRIKKSQESQGLSFLQHSVRHSTVFGEMETETDRIPLLLRRKGLDANDKNIKRELCDLGEEFMKGCGL